jgi:hypothetical protein
MTTLRRCKKCNREKLLIDFDFSDRKRGWRRHECRSCHRCRMNAHYLENKPHRLQRAKERYAADPSAVWTPERKQKAKERGRRYIVQWRNAVFDHYGWQCECCGETEPKFLTIDHINNDGAEHRKQIRSAVSLYRWLCMNGFPEGFQTLCYNCNCGRARNGGVCPHQSHGRLNDYPAREYAASDRQRKRPAFKCEG